ncbi:ceramide-1-phosphate transfer protein isoform 3-T3 [Spinachia spinachia]
MVTLTRMTLLRLLLLAAMLALLLFISSLWLPHTGLTDCGDSWQPCLTFFHRKPEPPFPEEAELPKAPPLTEECPGQSFQARHLLAYLKSSMASADDVMLEPYLQSWDELLNFMESLGTMVSFFSDKVKEKVILIRVLSLKRDLEAHGKRGTADKSGPQSEALRSIRSMVDAELKEGVVDFSRRTESGCRTLLRLHRSLLWLKLMLEGLAEGPDSDGRYRTPGELSRAAYMVALAPHHPWVLRQAAEFLFLALPDRPFFLRLVCARSQREATPLLHAIIHALELVHSRTQRILAEHGMLELP